MGSEGYLINEFIAAPHQPARPTAGAARYENRMRFPVEIVRRVRERVGEDFIIIYRLSMLDLVPGGSTLDEVITLAKAVEAAGATIINTGIGWHEARIPTIATSVPRGAYTWVTKKLMGEVSVPLVTTNRINTPELAEQLLADGYADMVSMARPMLADPDFVAKAAAGQPEAINTCIGCNQACLDHTFSGKITSCLVNPRACHETELVLSPTRLRKRVAVVGAGPAGLACAVSAAERGHEVTLFDAASEIGGQLNVARRVPGKEEFDETAALLPHTSSTRTAWTYASTRLCTAGDLRRTTTRSSSPPASPRAPPTSRASTTPASSATSTCCATARRSATASRSSARAASASTSPSSSPTAATRRARTRRRTSAQWGVDMDYTRARRPRRARAARPAAHRPPAAAQDHQGRRGPRQDHRLDPPHRAQAPRRHHGPGRPLRP